MPKLKYYAVAVGRDTGIFDTWEDVKPLVDGYHGSLHKSFDTRVQAEDWLLANRPAAPPSKRARLSGNGTPERALERTRRSASGSNAAGRSRGFAEENEVLDERQSRAVQLIRDGKNVLLSGCGGTGKSVVLRAAQRALKADGQHAVILAPTGCAWAARRCTPSSPAVFRTKSGIWARCGRSPCATSSRS